MLIRYGLIIISDKGSKGQREDGCKEVVDKSLKGEIFDQHYYIIIADEENQIQKAIKHCSDTLKLDLVLTCGGTGFSKRDVTPEATIALIEKPTPGISEAIRNMSLKETKNSMLSRAVSGIRKETLIINLPGSPKAVRECVDYIKNPLIHGIDIMKGTGSDCARK